MIEVRATVRNTGERDGTDLVQVYAAWTNGIAHREPIGFARVEVDAGPEAEAVLRIPVERLAQRDTAEHRMVVRPGDYAVQVTRNRGEPGLTSAITVKP